MLATDGNHVITCASSMGGGDCNAPINFFAIGQHRRFYQSKYKDHPEYPKHLDGKIVQDLIDNGYINNDLTMRK